MSFFIFLMSVFSSKYLKFFQKFSVKLSVRIFLHWFYTVSCIFKSDFEYKKRESLNSLFLKFNNKILLFQFINYYRWVVSCKHVVFQISLRINVFDAFVIVSKIKFSWFLENFFSFCVVNYNLSFDSTAVLTFYIFLNLWNPADLNTNALHDAKNISTTTKIIHIFFFTFFVLFSSDILFPLFDFPNFYETLFKL